MFLSASDGHLFILILTNDWRKGGGGDRAGPEKPVAQDPIILPCPTTNMC
jgi:hypothetical protein